MKLALSSLAIAIAALGAAPAHAGAARPAANPLLAQSSPAPTSCSGFERRTMRG
jgi:hypothetical protein